MWRSRCRSPPSETERCSASRRTCVAAADDESILAVVPVLDFDLLAARAHSRLWADLAKNGSDVGPHDRIVAATAISLGWQGATANVRHFGRIAGLNVVEVR
jgi:tRNA(fMet)-specific endonuclease VapC